MLDVEEYLIFIKELGRLFTDYQNCKQESIKQAIYADIQLLGKAIKS